jgi:hypothetical protein
MAKGQQRNTAAKNKRKAAVTEDEASGGQSTGKKKKTSTTVSPENQSRKRAKEVDEMNKSLGLNVQFWKKAKKRSGDMIHIKWVRVRDEKKGQYTGRKWSDHKKMCAEGAKRDLKKEFGRLQAYFEKQEALIRDGKEVTYEDFVDLTDEDLYSDKEDNEEKEEMKPEEDEEEDEDEEEKKQEEEDYEEEEDDFVPRDDEDDEDEELILESAGKARSTTAKEKASLLNKRAQQSVGSACMEKGNGSHDSAFNKILKTKVYKNHKFVTALEQRTWNGKFATDVFQKLKEKPSLTLWETKYKSKAIEQINQRRTSDAGAMKRNFIGTCMEQDRKLEATTV